MCNSHLGLKDSQHKKASRNTFPSPLKSVNLVVQAALTTAPDLMQRVHTLVFLVFPPALAICTVFKLGSQRLLVLLWAWETLLPVTGPLPQISHTFAMIFSFYLLPRVNGRP
jgi:hypothetical protein